MNKDLESRFYVTLEELTTICSNEDFPIDIRCSAGRIGWDLSEDYHYLLNTHSDCKISRPVIESYESQLMDLYKKI